MSDSKCTSERGIIFTAESVRAIQKEPYGSQIER